MIEESWKFPNEVDPRCTHVEEYHNYTDSSSSSVRNFAKLYKTSEGQRANMAHLLLQAFGSSARIPTHDHRMELRTCEQVVQQTSPLNTSAVEAGIAHEAVLTDSVWTS